jgi:hypothetical protein
MRITDLSPITCRCTKQQQFEEMQNRPKSDQFSPPLNGVVWFIVQKKTFLANKVDINQLF